MRDAAAEAYRAETGSTWRPRRGSHTSQTGRLTSAAIDARDFQRARKDRKTMAHLPQGTLVAIAGGRDIADPAAVIARLEMVRAKRPVGDQLQLAGLDLGAVLLALEVAWSASACRRGTLRKSGSPSAAAPNALSLMPLRAHQVAIARRKRVSRVSAEAVCKGRMRARIGPVEAPGNGFRYGNSGALQPCPYKRALVHAGRHKFFLRRPATWWDRVVTAWPLRTGGRSGARRRRARSRRAGRWWCAGPASPRPAG